MVQTKPFYLILLMLGCMAHTLSAQEKQPQPWQYRMELELGPAAGWGGSAFLGWGWKAGRSSNQNLPLLPRAHLPTMTFGSISGHRRDRSP